KSESVMRLAVICGGLLVCDDLRGAPRLGCPDGLPLCHLNLRASPATYRLTGFHRRGGGVPELARPLPTPLSQVASPGRYVCLRDSGEGLLLRRLRQRRRRTLPHGVCSHSQRTSGSASGDGRGTVAGVRVAECGDVAFCR